MIRRVKKNKKGFIVVVIMMVILLGTVFVSDRHPSFAADPPDWQVGVAYLVSDEVVYNESVYKCLQDHTSQLSSKPPVSGEHWQFQEVINIVPWTIGEAYAVGNIVSYSGGFYRCVSSHTAQAGQAPNTAGTLWVLVASPTNITSSTPNGTYGVGDTIQITVAFSRNINVSGQASLQLILNSGGVATYASKTLTSITFSYTIQNGENAADLNYASTDALLLNGATIKDDSWVDAGVTLPPLDGAGSLATNKDIVVVTSPAVTNITSTSTNGLYKKGDIIPVTVEFNQVVNVTGTPQLALKTGRTINYTSGSGTNTLTFNYTIQSGDYTTDLDYVSAIALTLNGGTIRNGSSMDATLTLPTPGAAGSLGANKNISVDGIDPTVVNVTSPHENAVFRDIHTVPITIEFSQEVYVTGVPSMSLNSGGTAVYTGGSGTTILSFDYDVQDGDYAVDLNYTSTSALVLNGGSIQDLAGNNAVLTLPALDGAGSLGTNKNHAIDAIDPTVTNVTSAAANGPYKAGDNIGITISFTQVVYVTGTPQLTLNTGRTIDYTSGSGSSTLTFNYTVQAGDNTADLNYLDTNAFAFNGGTIKDYAGNMAVLTLPATTGAGSLGTNKDIVIDTAAPTVTNVSATNANGSYNAGKVIGVTVTFSEAVNVSGTPRLALNTGRTANYSSGTGTNMLTFNYTVQAGDTTSDLNYVDTGSLTLNAGTIGDLVGNAAVLTLPATTGVGSLATNKNIVIDTTASAITNVTATNSDGAYKMGDTISITVAWNEIVNVTGTPQLALNTGRSAGYSSGSGTNTLTFNYTVQAGDSVADLNYVDTSSLTLNTGTIRDVAGNNAVLTLMSPSGAGSLGTNKEITIDGIAPTVTNVTATNANGSYNAGDVIAVTLNFSEVVNVTGTPQLSLNTGRTADYTSGTGTSTLTFNYTVQAGDTASDLNYTGTNSLILNLGTIMDAVANPAVLTLPSPGGAGSLGTNKDIMIDTTAPAVSSVTASNPDGAYKAGSVIGVTITFSEAIDVTGTPQLALNTGRTANYTSGTGTNTLTFNYTVQAGDTASDLNYVDTNSLGLNLGTLADAAGNAAVLTLPGTTGAGSLGTNKNIVIDTTAPTVASVTATNANGSYNASDVIGITITFSEAVNVTGTPQLALNTGRQASYTSGTGTNTLTFNYTVQAGDTASDLNYVDTSSLTLNLGSIVDAAGNSAVRTLPGTTEAGSLGTNKNIIIDTTAPTVDHVTSTNTNGSYKAGEVIAVTVTWSEVVSVTGTPQLVLNTGRTADYSSGTGTNTLTFNYTVQAGDTATDLNYVDTNALTLNAGTIQDAAGNAAVRILPAETGVGSLGTNKDIVIDTATPTVTNVTATNANGMYNEGHIIAVTLSFSEAVNVTGTPRLALNTGRTADYTGGTGTNTLTFNYTVQAGDTASDLNYANTNSLELNLGTIEDAAGNAAVLTLPATTGAGSLGTNKDIVIDTAMPTVSNVTATNANGTYKIGDVLDITITFNEAVNVSGTPQLALNTGESASYIYGHGTNTLTFSYTVDTGDSTNDLDYTGTNALTLNLGTITDLAGNDAVLALPASGAAGSLGNNKEIKIDGIVPLVDNVTSTNANGKYKAGDVVEVTVTFSETVNVTGTPRIALNTGRQANYSGGTGTQTLTFNYTVQAGDTAVDLDYASTNALTLNTGTIRDLAGNNASLGLPAVGGAGSLGANKDISIDTTAPTVTNVTATNANGMYKAGDAITVTVAFSEAVHVTGTPQLALNTGRMIDYSSGTGTNTLAFNYTVQAGDAAAELNYIDTASLSLNLGSIKDQAGNDALLALPATGGAGSLGTNKDIAVDGVAPTVVNVTSTNASGSYGTGAVVAVTVAFNEAVNVTGTPQLALNTGRIIDYSGGTGTNTLTFNYTVQAGDQTSGLNYVDIASLSLNLGTIADAAGNDAVLSLPDVGGVGALGTNKDLVIDGVDPTVANVTSVKANGTYKAGEVIAVTVTFDEAVNITGTPQLALNTGRTVDYSSGSGTDTLVFNYTVQAGDEAADLDYIDTSSLTLNLGTIKDAVGNDAVLALPPTGGVGSLGGNKDIRIDAMVPAVTSVSSTTANGTYTAGDIVEVTILFNETVQVEGTPKLALNTGRDAFYIGGDGTDTLIFNYTVQSGDVSADLDYAATTSLVLNGGTIQDAAGNNANLALPVVGALGSLGGSKDIVIAAGTSGIIYGDANSSAANVNLSAEGNEDWAHWGMADETSFNHKDGVAQQINNYLKIGAGTVSSLAGAPTSFSWSDGTPTVNTAGTAAGISIAGAGNGFEFTVLAGTQQKTLRVYIGATDARGKLEAVLSDGSAPNFTGYVDSPAGSLYQVYTITFKAESNGQTLTVRYTLDTDYTAPSGKVTLHAATLISPVVTKVSSTAPNGIYKEGDVLDITVKFSAMVNVTGTPQLALNSGAVIDYSGGTGTDTLTFTYTVGAGNASEDLDYVDVHSFSLNGGTITDSGGSNVSLLLPDNGWPDSLSGSKNLVIDTTAPTVSSVTSNKADGSYKLGDIIDIRVTFSETVDVTGTPQLVLNSGRTVNYTSGSGTSTLIFNYTVQAGDQTADLDYIDSNALTLNLGTIKDRAGIDAILTLPIPGGAGSLGANKGLVVDGVVATVNNVTSDQLDGTYKTGDTIYIKVVFSEVMTVTGTPQLELNAGSHASYTSGSGTDTLVFAYTVSQGEQTADLNYVATHSLRLNGGTINDLVGNNATLTLPETAGIGSLGTNKAMVIDGIVPTVTGVSSDVPDGTYKVGDAVDIKVTFNEVVTVTGTPQITLNTGAVVSYSSGSGTGTLVFNYTIGQGESTSNLNYVSVNSLALNGGTITDNAGNHANILLYSPSGAGSLGTSKNIVVDGVVPSVTNVTSTRSSGQYKAGDVIDIRVTFSELVIVTGTPQITLNTGAVVDYTSGSGLDTLLFNYTILAGDMSADLDYMDIHALSLNTGTIQDAAGNGTLLTLPATGGEGSLGANKDIVIDTHAPVVTGVTSPNENRSYKVGDILWVYILFDEVVHVNGTPKLSLNTGRDAGYISGSGSNTLVFEYTIGVGDQTEDLEYIGTNALSLNLGSLCDIATNDAVLTLPVPGGAGSLGANKEIVVDGVAPTVTNVGSNIANGTYKVGDVIDIRVTFSEAVDVTGIPQMMLNTGRTINYVSGSGMNTLVFNYTVQSGDEVSDLNYIGTNSLILNGGTIKDAVGNHADVTLPAIGGAGSLGTNKDISVDGIRPMVTNVTSESANAIYKAGDALDIQITFSETVTVSGTPTLVLNTGSVIDYISGSGSDTLVFRYTVGAGDVTSDLGYLASGSLSGVINDSAQNTAVLSLPIPGGLGSLSFNKEIIIDGLAPQVTEVTSSKANGTYAEGEVIDIQMNFSEVVTVVGIPQLVLDTGRTIDYISGSGTDTLVFRYTVGAGENTTALDYEDIHSLTGTIQDAASNDANLGLPVPGSANSLSGNKLIVIDTTAPGVLNVTSNKANGIYKAEEIIDIQVQFSETVHVSGTPGLSLNTGRTASYVSGSGTTTLVFRYVVQAGDTTLDLDYTAVNALAGSIEDTASNNAVLTLPAPGGVGSLGANKEIKIDTTVPPPEIPYIPIIPAQIKVVDVTSGQENAAYKEGAVIDIQVVFSDVVVVSGTPELKLNTGKTAGYVEGSRTNTLVFRYKVAQGDTSLDLDYLAKDSLVGSFSPISFATIDTKLPAPGSKGSLGANKDIIIDTTPPKVRYITSGKEDGTYRAEDVIDIQVVFDEKIHVVKNPTLKLNLNTGRSASYISGSGTDTLIFRYIVKVGDWSEDLDYSGTDALTGSISDQAMNDAILELPAPGGGNSLAKNKDITVNAQVPTIVCVTSDNQDGIYVEGDIIDIKVEFTDPVQVDGVPRIALNTGKEARYTSGSGTNTLVFRYQVQKGDLAEDLNYTGKKALDPKGRIYSTDLGDADTTLPGTLSRQSLGGNSNIAIDALAPAVVSVSTTLKPGSYKVGELIPITVTFSEKVEVTGAPILALNSGGIARYYQGSGSKALVFHYIVQSGETSGKLSYSSTQALILNGATIKDRAKNDAERALPEPNPSQSLDGIAVDGVAPEVNGVSILRSGDVMIVKVKFSENIRVEGTPKINLSKNKVATFDKIGSADEGIFVYQIKETDTIFELNDLQIVSFDLEAGIIADFPGNIAGEAIQKERKYIEIILQIGNPSMLVNGERKEIDPGFSTYPVIVNDRTIVPLRAVIESLGGTVLWDNKERKATFKLGTNTIEVWLGSTTVRKNGVKEVIDVAPRIINGRTMMPLRFVTESFGCEITWEGKTKRIFIRYRLDQ